MDIKYILTLRNNGIVSDLAPMPCSDEDSKDIAYIRKIFNFIESNPDKFDASRVYAEGFSQNSMFSAYIGFCFPDNVVGIWQGSFKIILISQLKFGGHNSKEYLPNLLENTYFVFCCDYTVSSLFNLALTL